MQTFYIGNSLVSDELAIALISDILTCFADGVLDWTSLAEEAPYSTVISIHSIAKIERQ